MMKNCRNCIKEFTSKHKNAKFCSYKCAYEYNRNNKVGFYAYRKIALDNKRVGTYNDKD